MYVKVSGEMRVLRDDSVDPYSSVRANYLGERQAEINELRR
jgi:ABC-type transporter lipoprotein component MlaA